MTVSLAYLAWRQDPAYRPPPAPLHIIESSSFCEFRIFLLTASIEPLIVLPGGGKWYEVESIPKEWGMFRGTFEHTIDDKGRVSVPARFREVLLASNDDRIVITNFLIGSLRCLEVYAL